MKPIYLIVTVCLMLFVSCEKDSPENLPDTDIKFVPTDVTVKTKGYLTIDKVFNFINSFDHQVEYIKYGVFTSDLPSDSLQYVLDYLNAKPYTHSGVWKVIGYNHSQTKRITIFPRLFQINNKEYQADWLRSMEKLQLVDATSSETGGYIIFFHVPVGEEKKWVEKFKEYDFVEWADLNQIVDYTIY